MSTSGASARTLDSALAASGLTRLDCIKLDIDGAEFAMLRGARQTPVTRWHPVIVDGTRAVCPRGKRRQPGRGDRVARDYGYVLTDAATGKLLAMDTLVIPPGASLNVVARAA